MQGIENLLCRGMVGALEHGLQHRPALDGKPQAAFPAQQFCFFQASVVL